MNESYLNSEELTQIYSHRIFGFWIYLMSDCILFATLFATYAILSSSYADGPTGQDIFKIPTVLLETLCLLISSFTYGLTMVSVHHGYKKMVLICLIITFLLGGFFVFTEIKEFTHLITTGNGPQTSAFLSAYFTLVGTHGLHVSVGLLWMAVLIGQVFTKGLQKSVTHRITLLSMFWHFLDLIWIGIFTVVYLIGVY